MILGKLLGPPDLIRAQTLCIHELLEIVIVGQDKDFILIALQVVPSSLKDFNDG